MFCERKGLITTAIKLATTSYNKMLMRAADVVQQLCNNFKVLSFIVSFIAVVISL